MNKKQKYRRGDAAFMSAKVDSNAQAVKSHGLES